MSLTPKVNDIASDVNVTSVDHSQNTTFGYVKNYYTSIMKFIKNLYLSNDENIKIYSLNFGAGISGFEEESSPTEYFSSKKSKQLHLQLLEIQSNALLDDWDGIKSNV